MIAGRYGVGFAPAPVPVLNAYLTTAEIANDLLSAGFRV